jgi:hypothetical protein
MTDYARTKARELLGRFIQARVYQGDTPPGTMTMQSALDYMLEVSKAMDAIVSVSDSDSEHKQETIAQIASYYRLPYDKPETPSERLGRLQEAFNDYSSRNPVSDGFINELADLLEEYLTD